MNNAIRIPPLAADTRAWSLLAANVVAGLVALHQGVAVSTLVILTWIQMNIGAAFGITTIMLFRDRALSIRLIVALTYALAFYGVQALLWALSTPGDPRNAPYVQAWRQLEAWGAAAAILFFALDGLVALLSYLRGNANEVHRHLLLPTWHPACQLGFLFFPGTQFVNSRASGALAMAMFVLLKSAFDIYAHRNILRVSQMPDPTRDLPA